MISIVINLDTRPGFLEQETRADLMLKGARSVDFLIDGVINKNKFFKDFEHETIVFIDYHDPLPTYILKALHSMLNTGEITSLTFSKHREYFNKMGYCPKTNDLNYLQAIAQAKGDYIAHFDADVAAFLNEKCVIENWLKLLEDNTYDFISYPSAASPKAVNDPAFDYMWASTRFFMCRRDTFRYDETLKCLLDSNYLYSTWGDRERKCPWFEHIISLITGGGNKVWYPPIDYDRVIIFSWNYYKIGILNKLNLISYNEVKNFVLERGGISYPNDLSV